MKISLNRKTFIRTLIILIISTMFLFFVVFLVEPYYYKEKIMKKHYNYIDSLKKECSKTCYEDVKHEFDSYLRSILLSIAYIALFDEEGEAVEIPLDYAKQYFYGGTKCVVNYDTFVNSYRYQKNEIDTFDLNEVFVFYDDIDKSEMICRDIVFKDGKKYKLVIVVNITSISEFNDVLVNMVPFVLILVVIISLITSRISSRIITKPITNISKIADIMSKNLEIKCTVKRKDEIGVIGDSLNILTDKLSVTLEELRIMNEKWEEDIIKEKENDKNRREFFYEASYKLNRPLNEISLYYNKALENIEDEERVNEYFNRILEIIDEIEVQVKGLLEKSRDSV